MNRVPFRLSLYVCPPFYKTGSLAQGRDSRKMNAKTNIGIRTMECSRTKRTDCL